MRREQIGREDEMVSAEQVRVKFTKTGNLQFISHLDLMRTVVRLMLRAEIPVAVTEGFNPHPKISFVLPLSVGTQSECEYLDFRITGDIGFSSIIGRMNAQSVPGLTFLRASTPVHKCGEVGFAVYDIVSAEEYDAEALFSRPIVVTKHTKSGDKETDIRPQVRAWKKEGNTLTVTLAASGADYLNPEYLVTAIGLVDYDIIRKKVLLADGETEFE